MKRSTRNPALARKTIIEKAAPIFNLHGTAGTSMGMLVEATGFQKGGIYNHFESKEALALAAFEYSYTQLKQSYVEITFNYAEPKDQLIAFLNAFKNFAQAPSVIGGCPILNQSVESDDTNERMRQAVKAAMEDWKYLLETIIAAGIKKGVFNLNLDPSKEAYFIISAIEGAIMLGKLKKSIALMHDMADQLMSYVEMKIFV